MTTPRNRVISLDALRGFTIAAMIVANFPGSEEFVYFTLRHSQWNALSFTDLIAPVFLFVVGVSIVFALLFYRTKFGTLSLNEHVVRSLSVLGLQPELASLLYALFFVGVNFIPAYLLYRNKVFIKL